MNVGNSYVGPDASGDSQGPVLGVFRVREGPVVDTLNSTVTVQLVGLPWISRAFLYFDPLMNSRLKSKKVPIYHILQNGKVSPTVHFRTITVEL